MPPKRQVSRNRSSSSVAAPSPAHATAFATCRPPPERHAAATEPVGVLQIHNKLDGRAIDKDEMERLQQVARLFGALGQKAQEVTATQKSMITLLDHVRRGMPIDFSSYMFRQDQGPFSSLYEELEWWG